MECSKYGIKDCYGSSTTINGDLTSYYEGDGKIINFMDKVIFIKKIFKLVLNMLENIKMVKRWRSVFTHHRKKKKVFKNGDPYAKIKNNSTIIAYKPKNTTSISSAKLEKEKAKRLKKKKRKSLEQKLAALEKEKQKRLELEKKLAVLQPRRKSN